MRQLCRMVFLCFSLLYLVALALLSVGTFGLFGVERDPLSGVFLVVLGMPWTLGVDAFPDPAWPWLAAAAPLVNLLLLRLVCRSRGPRPGQPAGDVKDYYSIDW